MPSLLPSMALFLQDNASMASDLHLIMIFEGIIAICILLIIVGAIVGALVVVNKVSKLSRDAQKTAQPLIAKSQELVGHVTGIVADLRPKIATISADLQPKIASVSSDVQHISGVVRGKVDEISQTVTKVNDTVQDVNGKTQQQVQRVNGMVSEALTTTEHVSRSIQHGIRVPVAKVVGWVAAAKAGLETLAARSPFMGGKTTAAKPYSPGRNSVADMDEPAVVVTEIR